MKNNLQQCGGIVPDLSNAISSKIQVQAATFHTCPNCGAVINKLPEPRRGENLYLQTYGNVFAPALMYTLDENGKPNMQD